MTDRKHLKARVRARMVHTGERYAAARAHVVSGAPSTGPADPAHPARGRNPGANALRLLLADLGLEVSEPLALMIGGGAGIGVFQFHYAKEAFSTMFLAGRHRWDDDLAFLDGAIRRLGLEPIVTETGSTRTADRQLHEAVEGGRPIVAWVDAATLDTRGLPLEYQGGAYHVALVRALDDAGAVAYLDDLADRSVQVPIDTLASARARIAKFRNRLLRLSADAHQPTEDQLRAAIEGGLDAMIRGLDDPRNRNFGLAALADWSARLRGSGKDAWPTVFPRGRRLWSGLASIHEYIEHYGSGGGLMRPMVAAGIREAADRLGDARLAEVSARYDELATQWTNLAHAALSDDVPAFRRTRELQDRRAAVYAERGHDAAADIAETWAETAVVGSSMTDDFPLDEAASRALLERLATLVDALRDGEVEALDALRATR